jgi:hypothetical protein
MWKTKFYTDTKHQVKLVLYICILNFLDKKTKVFELNGSKHS